MTSDGDGGARNAQPEHVDVLIVGAGLSGIGAACHLRRGRPGDTVAILEARDTIGGTWDLFRYPGIRSDSDMFTLGYRFKPWEDQEAIADGPAILRYVQETAKEYGVDSAVRFHHRVVRADYSGADRRWKVTVERTDTGETFTMTCGFLFCCSGYYRYDEGYTPDIPGLDRFAGEVVHPQHWPEDLDYAGKRVVVIGSGATAVTLVPAMAPDAEHVTMLQRSPTYIISQPGKDAIANLLRKVLPSRFAYVLARWKNVLLQTAVYQLSQSRPAVVKAILRRLTIMQLPKDYPVDVHFKPRYNPWDQRLCLVPDGDLFHAIRRGSASIATDHIDTVTETGILLRSGEQLDADIIITATGLNLLVFGGMRLVVDGEDIHLPDTMAYKGMMLSGVPNFAYIIGYTNASWTLKADLACEYICRLLEHMTENGYDECVPERDPDVGEEPFLDFSAGYVLRSLDEFPKQGTETPWKLRMNYLRDIFTLRHSPVDEAMRFRGGRVRVTSESATLR